MSTTPPESPAPGVLGVAVPTPLRRLFDYRPCQPAPSRGWQPGLRVRVPLGKREVVGVVVECRDTSDFPLDQLKPVVAWLDSEPLPEDWLWLCRFTARYYQHSLGDTLHQAMPVLLRQGRPLEARIRERWQLTASGRDIDLARLGRARRQVELLELLRQHPRGVVSSVIGAQGFTISLDLVDSAGPAHIGGDHGRLRAACLRRGGELGAPLARGALRPGLVLALRTARRRHLGLGQTLAWLRRSLLGLSGSPDWRCTCGALVLVGSGA